jgi:hypothetical protein
MSKVIAFSSSERFLPQGSKGRKCYHMALTTADYRRMLSELKLPPPSQRAFLRKLLTRATLTAPKQFPVATHVVHNLAAPS